MIHSNVQKVKFFSTPTKTDKTMKKFWYGSAEPAVAGASCYYCFYYICSGIVWGHYQWTSKLLTQIALCKHVYDNGTQTVKPKF